MIHLFKDVKKILVIKLRHIGDVLLSVPVFRALRENFPQAHIAALVTSGTEEVLTGNSLIDKIIVFDRRIKKMNPLWRYAKELSFLNIIRKKSFDMAVDLTSGDRAAIISFVLGAKYRLAYDLGSDGFLGKRYLYTHLAKKDGSKHMVLQNLDVVKQFGISTDDLNVDIFIPENARAFVKGIFEENNINPPCPPLSKGGEGGFNKIVHVHPTSRWLFKCWKDEYMAEVIRWLVEKGIHVIVTSSPDRKEMEKAKRILSLVGDSPDSTKNSNPPLPPFAKGGRGGILLDLCGKTTIKQLAAVSSVSDLFLGVDSAPMHIAAAVGTPVIALFGPTGETQWGPWGENHKVISKYMNCKPCKRGVCDGIELRKCLETITKEEVIDALSSALGIKMA
jgi:heptosyltransferase-3